MWTQSEAEWPLHIPACIIFLIIQWLGVNFSTYTTVDTPQDIDQMIYFKAFVRFFYFNRYCE